MSKQPSLRDIEAKVLKEFDSAIVSQDGVVSPFVSSHFRDFKKEEREELALRNFYEKFCFMTSSYIKLFKLKGKMREHILENINIAGLHVRPDSIISATIFTLLIGIFSAVPFLILGMNNLAFFIVSVALFLSYIVLTYPSYSAEITKIRAEQESIMAILYMNIYMRLNPVLENAIYFATEHLNGPLAKDLKNLLWLLDSQKVSSLEEGIERFMNIWTLRNKDFVRSLLTLHSILNQTTKEGQERVLDKSLNEILRSTYEKMKRYSNDMKMPVLMLHTFGLMLPLIGLIGFPMISIFMADSINVSHLFFGYIVVLPSIVFFLTRRILSKRPGAFSSPDLTSNPKLPPKGKYMLRLGDNEFLIPVLPVAIAVGLVIMIPGIIHVFTSTIPAWKEATSIGAVPSSEYSLQALFLSTTIPIGLGVGTLINFHLRSVQRIRLRNMIQEIEQDLAPSVFQLGNQFNENVPVEVAVENFVGEYELLNLKKKSIYEFFSEVLDRLRNDGVPFSVALFDPIKGVLTKYPSVLLKEIMWVMVEGSRKGAAVLLNVMKKVSNYLTNANKIKELIYDLLNSTVSSINLQAKFLAPFLAGLVGSLTLIIVKSLYQMMKQLQRIMELMQIAGANMGDDFFTDFINFTKVTPPTIFQILVGIYAVETVVLLSILANGVEKGFDNTSRNMMISKNLLSAMIVYLITIFIGALVLNMLVQQGIAAGEI